MHSAYRSARTSEALPVNPPTRTRPPEFCRPSTCEPRTGTTSSARSTPTSPLTRKPPGADHGKNQTGADAPRDRRCSRSDRAFCSGHHLRSRQRRLRHREDRTPCTRRFQDRKSVVKGTRVLLVEYLGVPLIIKK